MGRATRTNNLNPTLALIIITLLFAALTSYAFLDLSISRAMQTDSLPGDIRSALDFMGGFGHGIACLIASLVILFLDQNNRKHIKTLFVSTFVPGITATITKVLTQRARPTFFTHSQFEIEATAQSTNAAASTGFDLFNSSLQSFPSGHTATAFGLAIGLSYLYPRGKWLFFSFAILTGVQRVVSQAHFASDVFAGAAIGILAGYLSLWVLTGRHSKLNQLSSPVRIDNSIPNHNE